MPMHDYYEELCALLPIGQLSAGECQELADHLRSCAGCRDATGDFSVILDKMPVSDADLDEESLSELQGRSYRERFLKRAVAEGVPFTDAVTNLNRRPRGFSWPRISLMPAFAVAACTIIAVLSLQVYRLSQRAHDAVQPAATAVVRHQAVAPAAARSKDEPASAALQAKIAAFEAQAADQQKRIAALGKQLRDSKMSAESEKEESLQLAAQLTQANAAASETSRQLAAVRLQLDQLRTDKNDEDAALVSQQFKINDLQSEVKLKDAAADRERQLSSVAKDVRELMGARNLHILDVSDVDGDGRPKKSFGRVFLVEGKSLIFYAFDLSDHGNPERVSFQAWGQLEGHQAGPKNLGVFYVDDHAQKRWVLKVNDPRKLVAINSVFVTVEPLGGAKQPTGKRLLYAYLGTQANHP